MESQKVGAKALAVVKDGLFKIPSQRPPKKILKEEDYTKDLEKIIVRDFYPELPKLQAQKEYIEALQRNDVVTLRRLQLKYGPKRPSTSTPDLYNSPATFETPAEDKDKQTPKPPESADGTEKPVDKDATPAEAPTHNPELKPKKTDSDRGLDSYLSRNTSEDNSSFAEILAVNQRAKEVKHAWLYEQEAEKGADVASVLALPTIEQQAAITGPRTQELQTWTYTAKNALMYVPEGAAHTTNEVVEKKSKPRQIVHTNTRFKSDPFDTKDSKNKIAQAAEQQANSLAGKIGVDGQEIKPSETPKVGGFGFVKTPSPAPGVDESPLMTWGEIEGTPFRLDGGGTPRLPTPGPTFTMQGVSRREELALALSEKASKAHRDKKQAALKRVSALAPHTPKFGSPASRTQRLTHMSPAAQRLASTKLGIRTHTDKALRASYTPSPSPSHRLPGDKTPKLTPRRTPKTIQRTPKEGGSTPVVKTASTPKRDSTTEMTSLTDNLLQLPKRPKAEDFF